MAKRVRDVVGIVSDPKRLRSHLVVDEVDALEERDAVDASDEDESKDYEPEPTIANLRKRPMLEKLVFLRGHLVAEDHILLVNKVDLRGELRMVTAAELQRDHLPYWMHEFMWGVEVSSKMVPPSFRAELEDLYTLMIDMPAFVQRVLPVVDFESSWDRLRALYAQTKKVEEGTAEAELFREFMRKLGTQTSWTELAADVCVLVEAISNLHSLSPVYDPND